MHWLFSIAAILLIIVLHELGHFLVAKAFGIHVTRFSIGFGRSLCAVRWGHTTYALSAIPLGGYVQFEEDPPCDRKGTQTQPDPHCLFEHQALWKRCLVILAGPATNFLLAILCYAASYHIGYIRIKPVVQSVLPHSLFAATPFQEGDTVTALGGRSVASQQALFLNMLMHIGSSKPVRIDALSPEGRPRHAHINLKNWRITSHSDAFKAAGLVIKQPHIPPLIMRILPYTPASSTLRTGDRILSINGTPMPSWQALTQWIQQHPNQTLTLGIMRQNRSISVKLHAGSLMRRGVLEGYWGAGTSLALLTRNPLVNSTRTGWLQALQQATAHSFYMIRVNLHAMRLLITGRLPISSLSGPVGIAAMGAHISALGISASLRFLALVSLSIGLVNLLPLPLLDGGQCLLALLEAATRRTVSPRALQWINQFGLSVLIALALFVTLNDIRSLLPAPTPAKKVQNKNK